jgi:hypothetical protein
MSGRASAACDRPRCEGPSPRTGARIILFHPAGADAAAAQHVRIVRVLHVVDVADFLDLAHRTDLGSFAEVFDVDAGPSLMGHTRLRPFAGTPRDGLAHDWPVVPRAVPAASVLLPLRRTVIVARRRHVGPAPRYFGAGMVHGGLPLDPS